MTPPPTSLHPSLLQVQKSVSPKAADESQSGQSVTSPLLQIHRHILPPATSILELDNERKEIVANFPGEGFRLRLQLADNQEHHRQLVKLTLLRPRKDADLTSFLKPVLPSHIIWMGYSADIG